MPMIFKKKKRYAYDFQKEKEDMPMDRGGPQKEKTLGVVEMPTTKLVSN